MSAGRSANVDQKLGPTDVSRYEGLIFKTALRIADRSNLELDDIRQELRIKAWRALEAYDPARSSQPVDRFVFSCLFNLAKDIVKKRRHGEVYIEDVAPGDQDRGDAFAGHSMARDGFEARYLAVEEESVFGEVEEEGVVIPSTLTARERAVLVRLYRDYGSPNASEIGRELGLTRSQMETVVAGIREKMADWKPTPELATVVDISPARLQQAA